MVEGMDAERQSEERCAAAACPGMSACLACPEDAHETARPLGAWQENRGESAESDNEWSGPIWPGPECLVNDAQLAEWQRGSSLGMRLWATRKIVSRDRQLREAMVRTRGIAEGHVRARARMERFRLWLAEHEAPMALRDAAERAMSPEAVVLAAAEVEVRWLGWSCRLLGLIHYHLCSRRGASPQARSILVKHPNWAALPWQREGVGHG